MVIKPMIINLIKRHSLLVSCAPVIILFITYSPSFFIDFAHHDQYRYFNNNFNNKSCIMDTQFKGLFYDLGRPLGALVECLIFKNVRVVNDLNIWRLLCSIVLAINLLLIAKIFKKTKVNNDITYFVFLPWLICIPFLPGIQYLIQMTNLANLLGMFTASLSFYILNFSNFENILNNIKNQFCINFFKYSISVMLLFLSLLTYPAISTIFITLTGIRVFLLCYQNNYRKGLNLIVLNGTIFIICVVIFILVTKYLLHPIVNYNPTNDAYSFKVTWPDISRLDFAYQYLIKGFSLWDIYSNHFIFLSVIFINILAVTSIPNRQIWSKQFFCFLTWLGVIFSLTLAILITNFNEPLFRIMIPLMVFISF